MNGRTVAVVGATGAVGEEVLRCLERRRFPVDRLVPMASTRSAGKKVCFAGADHDVVVPSHESFRGVDFAFFAAGKKVSQELVPVAVDAGAVVIDNSSAFRSRSDVPLVVPEINAAHAFGHKGVIANPNCSTAILLLAVAPLHRRFGVEQIIASTYQAVSGAGAHGIDELRRATASALEGTAHEPVTFTRDIAFNIIPWIGAADEEGSTDEEWKMQREGRKILDHPTLLASCTCVRVPVMRTHSISATVFLAADATLDDVRSTLAEAPGLRFHHDDDPSTIPTPADVAGRDDVVVCRVRRLLGDPQAVGLFVLGDQLLKGAALNAVQIAEVLIAGASIEGGAE